MNTREQQVKESRGIFCDQRAVAFFRGVRATGSAKDCLAVTLINEELDTGVDLDTIFYTGEPYGYSLEVSEKGPDLFRISFGCQAGPEAGDGGSWSVRFEGDAVVSIEPDAFWIS
jgi:hypothetical protein